MKNGRLLLKKNRIQFTKGCLNQCSYCYERPPIITFNPDIPQGYTQILDMNFLHNPQALEILKGLPKGIYELVCGIDHRKLTSEICNLLKKKGFIRIRWAWDYSFGDQRKHQAILNMLNKAGYQSRDLSIFILVNWKITFMDNCRKLDLLKIWGVKVNDCCYDGGYPKSEIDFNNNPRFKDKHFWSYGELLRFRRLCRKHNQLVRFRIDPEY